ncbi:hypothetical protein GCM10023168_29400 [Fodinibacter luteus]|uniref:Tetratricopeptide repeat protein n=1 Tax=Fodinibacter luteus TaxID=552064 RepID=A0ABP8KLF0_9MICO
MRLFHLNEHSSIARRNREVARLQAKGSIEKALAAAEETEQLAVAHLPQEDVERGKALYNLASIQVLAGDQAAAQETYRRALEAMRVAVGEQHDYFGRTLRGLGRLLVALGRYEEAERHFVSALMIHAKADQKSSQCRLLERELVILHGVMSKRETAEAAERHQSRPSSDVGEAHYEQTLQVRAMRSELDEMPSELRAFAEKNLDAAGKMFSEWSTHSLALVIIQARRERGEPFVLLLRGFEGEAYDYFVDNPKYMTDDPERKTLFSVWGEPGEVELALHQTLDGRLSALTAASPSSLDADQSSQDALLPRLILPNETWLDEIRAVIRLAHLIVVDCLGLNPGLRSELEAIEQCGKCDNTVIVLHKDRSKLDEAESLAIALADITGGTLSSDPTREWMRRDHPLLAPFRRVAYIEDLRGTDLSASGVFADLFKSAPYVRSAVRLAQKGTALVESGDAVEGAKYLQVALVLAQDIPGWAERAVTWFNIGVLAQAIGRPQEAIRPFLQGQAAGLEMRNAADQGRCLTMLGQVYLETKQFSEAARALLASLAFLEEAEDADYLTESFRLLCLVFQALGQTSEEAATQVELSRLQREGRWRREGAGQRFNAMLTEQAHAAQ